MHKEVLHARGLECDDRISKLSEEKLKEILEEVRKLRYRRRTTYHNVSVIHSHTKHYYSLAIEQSSKNYLVVMAV